MVADRRERGVALLLALLTLVLLSVVVVDFTFSSQVAYRRAVTWIDARRAALVADAGVALAAEVLSQDFSMNNVDTFADIWARELPPIETGAGQLTIRIEDEQGKLNLNALASGALSPAGRRAQALFDLVRVDPALAFALADWVDRNREPGPSALAAEDSWYAALVPPYTPRNQELASFAELALVRGFDAGVLAAIRPVATALPGGDTKINANTAPRAVLAALDPRLADDFLLTRILETRALAPLTTVASLRAVDGMQAFSAAELARLFTFSSNWFRVRSTGRSGAALRSVEALLYRENGISRPVYLLRRRGPNIVGADSDEAAPIDDAGLLGGHPS